MKLYYDPLNSACKSRIGAIPRASELTFHVFRQGGEDHFSAVPCYLLLGADGCEMTEYPMTETDTGWTVTLKFHRVGLYFYHFRVGEKLLVCGRMRQGVESHVPASWQITVYSEQYRTPDWFKGGVMYQIFPDRFRKCGDYPIGEHKVLRRWGELPYYRPDEYGQVLNNDFFGGNFNGIREKLGYLQSLGVTTIYLNPVFEAFSNHRYDTGDYKKLDSLLGTMGDFTSLVEEAKARGIRIILDGVFNHTGADSYYFNRFGRYPSLGAYQSPDSPYSGWYRFRSYPNDYDCWWGIKSLPAVNEHSSSYQEFMFGQDGVIKHWLRAGVSGYRLDVADELPDFFLKNLRTAAKDCDPDALIIGEVWEDASNKIAYDVRREYLQGSELDSVMNYPLKDAIIGYVLSGSANQLRSTMATLVDNYPEQTLHSLMNVLGTHDTPRILTVLGRKICTDKDEMARTWLSEEEKARAIELLKLAALLQFTLPGVPCVYYGDENGMEGYADPFCRRCFDWDNLNEPLIAYYQKLAQIREHELPAAFKDGAYREVFADISCLVFERKSKEQTAYIYVNRSASEYKISFRGRYREHLTGKTFSDKLYIAPYAYGILSKI